MCDYIVLSCCILYRTFVVDIFTEIGVQEANRYFLRELDEFDTWVGTLRGQYGRRPVFLELQAIYCLQGFSNVILIMQSYCMSEIMCDVCPFNQTIQKTTGLSDVMHEFYLAPCHEVLKREVTTVNLSFFRWSSKNIE